jgi:NADH-ubiquinone oxidoreductase chain 4
VLQFFYSFELLELASIDLIMGLDGLSLFFIILTTFIIIIALIAGWNLEQIHLFIYILLIVEIFLIFCFSVFDILGFYIVFEVILIPMFFLVGYWGSRSRKIKAAYYLFLFTAAGSLFMLFALFLLYVEVGTLN